MLYRCRNVRVLSESEYRGCSHPVGVHKHRVPFGGRSKSAEPPGKNKVGREVKHKKGGLTGHIIPEPHRGERHDDEVDGLQLAPALHIAEHECGGEDKEQAANQQEEHR